MSEFAKILASSENATPKILFRFQRLTFKVTTLARTALVLSREWGNGFSNAIYMATMRDYAGTTIAAATI